MKRPVQLLYVTAGHGHKTAARALREALDKRYRANVVLDILAFSNKLFNWTFSNAYDFFSEHGHLALKGIYKLTDQKGESSNFVQLLNFFSTRNVEGFEQYINDNRDSPMVCTHFFPAQVLTRLRAENTLKGSIYAVVTDYSLHRMWVNEGIDRYYVGSEAVRDSLVRNGVPQRKIRLTGIPISDRFSQPINRESIIKEHGLDPRRFTLLLIASAMTDSLTIMLLEELLGAGMQMNLLLVAGRNRDVLEKLERYHSTKNVELRKFGFIHNLHELMGVSTLMITKPGGLTVSEALAMHTPMLMFKPIPYQETYNAQYIEQKGAGVLARSEEDIMRKISLLYHNPKRLREMTAAAKEISFPNAAGDIADSLLQDEAGSVDPL
ncbi:MAG: hypothetical protein K9L28_05435 [Synergistales bacterium]|nr:hypothetical protein [Synergistales bacterium]